MANAGQDENIDFSVDKNNLYNEESITDLKVASIRVLKPVNIDGTEDNSRKMIYIGHTQLMSPQGPIPIQAKLKAENLKDAIDEFPEAMKQSMAEMIERARKMQAQMKQQNDSRIIVPGR
ncbi:MAG: cytoplasmic protein [Proteobacteria bacterium]|nr:cytoplasmic protein [Pseudomonadota bacterium]